MPRRPILPTPWNQKSASHPHPFRINHEPGYMVDWRTFVQPTASRAVTVGVPWRPSTVAHWYRIPVA